jgi:hypothetical protein
MKAFTLITLIIITIFPFAATAKESPPAATVDTIQVLKISPQDGRAVVKILDGKTRIIKVGDIVDNDFKVAEISGDTIVLEERKRKGSTVEKVIIRLVDGKQMVQRMGNSGGTPPAPLSPSIHDSSKKQK